MSGLRKLFCMSLFIGLTLTPVAVIAGLKDGDLPASRWYAHVDLEEMRATEAGKHLYEWLDKEVFSELREEAGFDPDTEADELTAMSTPDGGLVFSMTGNFTQKTKDRMIALGAAGGNFDQFSHNDKVYYRVENDEPRVADDVVVENLYYSVALKNQVIAASSESILKSMLDNRGKISGDYDADDALIVLTAKKSLVQAGMDADGLSDERYWDSNVLRNAKQLALLIADKRGQLAIEAHLVAEEAEMANSLASIVRGLISLQVFDEDMDPEVSKLLQSTNVDVDGATLQIEVTMDPETVVGVLDD